jgi:hypothetical protein
MSTPRDVTADRHGSDPSGRSHPAGMPRDDILPKKKSGIVAKRKGDPAETGSPLGQEF